MKNILSIAFICFFLLPPVSAFAEVRRWGNEYFNKENGVTLKADNAENPKIVSAHFINHSMNTMNMYFCSFDAAMVNKDIHKAEFAFLTLTLSEDGKNLTVAPKKDVPKKVPDGIKVGCNLDSIYGTYVNECPEVRFGAKEGVITLTYVDQHSHATFIKYILNGEHKWDYVDIPANKLKKLMGKKVKVTYNDIQTFDEMDMACVKSVELKSINGITL